MTAPERYEFRTTVTTATGKRRPPPGPGWQHLSHWLLHTPAGCHWSHLWMREVLEVP